MRVKDLIEKLLAFDPNLRVVTPGFDEWNLEDVETVERVKVVFHDKKKGSAIHVMLSQGCSGK